MHITALQHKRIWRNILLHSLALAVLLLPFIVYGQADPRGEAVGAAAPGGGDVGRGDAKSEGTGFIGSAIESIIYSFATGVGGIFLWIGGSLLDYAISELVIGMGAMMSANLGVIIDQMWVVVRDFFNIVFIFSLIYIGFRTILYSDDSSTRKSLGLLIVAALLINFSLFFTKAIIDFSNIAAFQIHNAIIANSQTGAVIGGAGGGSLIVGGEARQSISSSFMNAIQLTSYADGSAIAEMRKNASFISGRFIFFGIAMMFFMLFAAFVFAAGAMFLIARFITLIFAMILSPMMFLPWIIPMQSLQKYGQQWWNTFLKSAFFAPAYLFMIYLSLWAIAAISGARGGSFGEAFSAGSTQNGMFFIILYFFIVTGFLVAALKVAEMMGTFGAQTAINSTKYLRGFAGGATFGLAARGLRNTVGYGAQRLAESERVKNMSSTGGIGSRVLARSVINTGRFLGDQSFDVRNNADLNLGEGKKGGYKTQRDAIKKKELEYAAFLGEVSDDDKHIVAIDSKVTQNKKTMAETQANLKAAREKENQAKAVLLAPIDEEINEALTERNSRLSEQQSHITESQAKIAQAEEEIQNTTSDTRKAELQRDITSYQKTISDTRAAMATTNEVTKEIIDEANKKKQKIKAETEAALSPLEEAAEAEKKLLEEENKELEKQRKAEKQRRRIGTDRAREKYSNAEKALEEAQAALADNQYKKRIEDQDLAALTKGNVDGANDDLIAQSEAAIAKLETEIAENKKAAAIAMQTKERVRKEEDFGYANALKTSFLESFLFARLPDQDITAGKEIEKKYAKPLKRTDEEQRNVDLVEAIKANKD